MKRKEGRSPFRFERIRLLHRSNRIELWEGFAKDRPQIIKRFLGSGPRWGDFILQSRLKNPILLQSQCAGLNRDGFCMGMPYDFAPEMLTGRHDLSVGVIQVLSLAHSLRARKMIFQWNPDHLLLDRKSGKVFLPGLRRVKRASSQELDQHTLSLLLMLRELVRKHHDGTSDLERMIRQGERRKQNQLEGCVQTLLANCKVPLEDVITIVEWPRSKELEVVTGLFQLAERGKGRAVHFYSDPGEGKSTLLKQIYCELISRDCSISYFPTPPKERPNDAARTLLETLLSDAGMGRPSAAKPMTEDFWIASALKAIERQIKKFGCCAILIDDAHHFDPASHRLLQLLFKQIHSHQVLFIVTSRGSLELPDSVISLSMDCAPLSDFLDGYSIPFWKQKQKAFFFEKVYERTSGNPLLFHEYLEEAMRQRRPEQTWEDGEWYFPSSNIPDFPDAVLDFYLKRISDLTADELNVLEQASVQGDRFVPDLIDEEKQKVDALLHSLSTKGFVSNSHGGYYFRKPLVAEAFYNKIEKQKLKEFHRSLAQELLKKDSRDLSLVTARHFLKAGDYDQAFQMGRRAIQQFGKHVETSVLDLYQQMLPVANHLKPNDELELQRDLSEIYQKRGNYPSAAACLERALLLSEPNSTERFSLAVRLADACLLNNEVLRAEKLLQEQQRLLKSISDRRSLFQYYFTRARCCCQRGPREEADFTKAFAIAEELGDYDALAQGYRQQAILCLRDGHLKEARTAIRKSLLFAQRNQNPEESGHALRTLASIAWRESKHKLAEHLLRRSIRSFQRVQNANGMACAWSLLGNVLVERCRFPEAVQSFQKALLLFSRVDHPHEVTLAQFNLGLVYLEQGLLKQAEKIFLRCRQIDKNAGNRLSVAYDLRALGVLSMIRGFHKRAARFLKRTVELCEELQAEGDLVQTKMILLFNELQRKNYKDCHPLVLFLQKQLPLRQEPMTRAEIHYLLAHYFGFTQQSHDALDHIDQSLRIAKKIRHHKLIGQNLILRLILKGSVPARNDADLRRAFHSFYLSHNKLESASYVLQLYQAYPSLLRQKYHMLKLTQMDKVFRNVQHRAKHRMLRQLARTAPSQEVSIQPFYDWWQRLLQLFHDPQPLETRLRQVLHSLSEEIHASFSLLQYLNDSGTYERVAEPDRITTKIVDELPSKVFDLMMRRRESLCVDPTLDPSLARNPWVIVHEVRSFLAVPVLKGDQLLAFWYFERRGQDPSFLQKDLNKIAFFSLAAAPTLESILSREFSTREQPGPVVSSPFQDMIGQSKAMQEVYRQLAKVASVDISVLILGESGTGKELVAKNLHRHSRRSSGPFLALNCSALPETLIESELFGFARGAFTGASATKPGLIERANGGTLFLDEIGDLSEAAQAKLLRVIQEREIQRLGETSCRKVDVRFLFATHKNLKKLVHDGKYREDLFYRISVHVITIPPLRERKEDIPLLVTHFRNKYARSLGKEKISFSAATMRRFCEYSWPGNIRELENVTQSLLINSDSNRLIEEGDLPPHLTKASLVQKLTGASLEEGKQEFEKQFLLQALQRHGWNKTQTARELKISRQGLINMIERLSLKEPGKDSI